VPGWIAEEVARQIAQMLNAPKIHGIGFSLPYKEVNIYDVEESK